jgi:hypothetical protein
LLEEVVEQDPDHREATGILLERLVAQGDLARAWPQAQIYVMQVRSQQVRINARHDKYRTPLCRLSAPSGGALVLSEPAMATTSTTALRAAARARSSASGTRTKVAARPDVRASLADGHARPMGGRVRLLGGIALLAELALACRPTATTPIRSPSKVASPGPLLFVDAAPDGSWVHYCQPERDTNGDGVVGEGDRLTRWLWHGGRRLALDAFLAASPTGHQVVVGFQGSVWLLDFVTGHRVELDIPPSDHYEVFGSRAAFDATGERLAYLRRAAISGPAEVIVRDVGPGTERTATVVAGLPWQVGFDPDVGIVVDVVIDDLDGDGRLALPTPAMVGEPSERCEWPGRTCLGDDVEWTRALTRVVVVAAEADTQARACVDEPLDASTPVNDLLACHAGKGLIILRNGQACVVDLDSLQRRCFATKDRLDPSFFRGDVRSAGAFVLTPFGVDGATLVDLERESVVGFVERRDLVLHLTTEGRLLSAAGRDGAVMYGPLRWRLPARAAAAARNRRE